MKQDAAFAENFERISVGADGVTVVLVPTDEFIRLVAKNPAIEAIIASRMEGIDYTIAY